MVRPEVFAEGQEPLLAAFDGGGFVVALLHGLQHLLLAQRDLVVLEPRRGQHLAQNGQAFVQILGQQVQAHAALVIADARVELRGQKGQALFEVLGGLGLRAAPRQQVAGQVGQALFARRFQIRPGAGIDDNVDQRQFAVGHDVGHGPALEGYAELVRCGRLVGQRRIRELLRPVGNGRLSKRDGDDGAVQAESSRREGRP